jgi:large subunit ribosomal protein L3
MSVLIGKKVGMTQVYTDKGDCVPVTVIQVERCVPVLKRTEEKDGYQALMLAYGNRKPKHTNKPLKGFYDKHKVEPAKILREFRGQDVDDEALGKPLKVDVFSEGDRVEVVGVSKGRGFAGVFKRFNFGGAPANPRPLLTPTTSTRSPSLKTSTLSGLPKASSSTSCPLNSRRIFAGSTLCLS